MNEAFLLLGGNMGDRLFALKKASKCIENSCGPIIKASSVYETAAWGKTDQTDYLNQVIHIKTHFSAEKLLQAILSIEEKLGRKRKDKYDPRTIDIDILFFNDSIINTQGLKIPHPQLHNRRFALEPLKEIAPGKIHPIMGKSISDLLQDCNDKLDVHKIN